jgi:hypothetical protein
MSASRRAVETVAAFAVGLLLVGVVAVTAAPAPPDASPANSAPAVDAPPADNHSDREPIEEEYVRPAPEEGDPYFEAAAEDGSWVSYLNPRDEYRDPYLGDGSGKLCVTLLNEDGEVVVGESVPNTKVTMSTGETLDWHSRANPMEVRFPVTDHYEFPLDGDQFGTSPSVVQGDGYMDSHCIEFHGPDENATITYGPVEVEGERADWIEVVGYIQQEHEAWDTSVDPLEDAVPYEEVGGWTYRPGGSHGQAVVVLQLDPPADAYPDKGSDTGGEETTGDGTDTDGESDTDGTSDTGEETNDDGSETDTTGESETTGDETDTNTEDDTDGTGADNPLPGFGAIAALTALVVGALARARR